MAISSCFLNNFDVLKKNYERLSLNLPRNMNTCLRKPGFLNNFDFTKKKEEKLSLNLPRNRIFRAQKLNICSKKPEISQF